MQAASRRVGRHKRVASFGSHALDPITLLSPKNSNSENNAAIAIKLKQERQQWEEERLKFVKEIEDAKAEALKSSKEAADLKELSIMLQDKLNDGSSREETMHSNLRSLIDLSPDMEIATDRHTKVREWNSIAERWTGRPRSAVEGKKLVDALDLSLADKAAIKNMQTIVKHASSGGMESEKTQLEVMVNGEMPVMLTIMPWLGMGNVAVGAAVTGRLIDSDAADDTESENLRNALKLIWELREADLVQLQQRDQECHTHENRLRALEEDYKELKQAWRCQADPSLPTPRGNTSMHARAQFASISEEMPPKQKHLGNVYTI